MSENLGSVSKLEVGNKFILSDPRYPHTENNSLDSSVGTIKYFIHFILLMRRKTCVVFIYLGDRNYYYCLFISTTLLNCVGVYFLLVSGRTVIGLPREPNPESQAL